MQKECITSKFDRTLNSMLWGWRQDDLGGDEHDLYMRMLNVGWKSSEATGFRRM